AMRILVLGDAIGSERIAGLATPGGTGAVAQGLELLKRANPDSVLWISDPSWPNHAAIAGAKDVPFNTYRYYCPEKGAVDLEGMLQDLKAASRGDTVLLHACCHNPTGADLKPNEWDEVASFCARKGLIALIDCAYQGFGHGIDEDAEGLRRLVAAVPEALVAISGSKTFGLYRDRVGCLLTVAADPDQRDLVAAVGDWINRLSYAFPPDHGARVVTMILQDDALRRQWLDELSGMRARIIGMRSGLALALAKETGSDRFDFLSTQLGLFSRLGISPDETQRLRGEHGVYIVGDGRINFAGLTPETLAPAASAISTVVSGSKS
ncbi:MAG: aromatic amino acid transaminase, partial [Pseudomonadota bacterium]